MSNSHIFQAEVKFNSCYAGCSYFFSFLHNIYIHFLYCWTCTRPEYAWNNYRWTLINKQNISITYIAIVVFSGCQVFLSNISEHHTITELFIKINDHTIYYTVVCRMCCITAAPGHYLKKTSLSLCNFLNIYLFWFKDDSVLTSVKIIGTK